MLNLFYEIQHKISVSISINQIIPCLLCMILFFLNNDGYIICTDIITSYSCRYYYEEQKAKNWRKSSKPCSTRYLQHTTWFLRHPSLRIRGYSWMIEVMLQILKGHQKIVVEHLFAQMVLFLWVIQKMMSHITDCQNNTLIQRELLGMNSYISKGAKASTYTYMRWTVTMNSNTHLTRSTSSLVVNANHIWLKLH